MIKKGYLMILSLAIVSVLLGSLFYLNFMRRTSEWDYVAFGDSTAAGRGSYVDYYAAHIEADLGVKVTLHNWGVSGETSAGLLRALRNNQELRNAIRAAEVVTLVIGANDMQNAFTLGRDMQEALMSFKTNFDAIIAEILSLSSPRPFDTIIRTMDYFNPVVSNLKKAGIYDKFKPYWDSMNEHIVQAASEHNIPVAQVYLAFNGPNGDEDPVGKGYIAADGIHLSDMGNRLVAELHRELGYQPLGPSGADIHWP